MVQAALLNLIWTYLNFKTILTYRICWNISKWQNNSKTRIPMALTNRKCHHPLYRRILEGSIYHLISRSI